jgi:RecB family endonuclease NucS
VPNKFGMSSFSKHEALRILNYPGFKEAADAIMNATSRKKAVVVLGSCEVRYKGRTTSYLSDGERIVILKEDGSVLVHQVWGYKPVNYQPPGSLVFAKSAGNSVIVSATRKTGGESIQVVFTRVYTVIELNFWDESLSELNGTESQMREAVVYLPELVEKGLKVITQEFPIKSGFVDLLALDSKDRLVAIEFKRINARTVDVNQLIAYVSRLRANSRKRQVRGVLAAPGINKSAKRLLVESGLEFKPLETGKCISVVEKLKKTQDLLAFIDKGAAE